MMKFCHAPTDSLCLLHQVYQKSWLFVRAHGVKVRTKWTWPAG